MWLFLSIEKINRLFKYYIDYNHDNKTKKDVEWAFLVPITDIALTISEIIIFVDGPEKGKIIAINYKTYFLDIWKMIKKDK